MSNTADINIIDTEISTMTVVNFIECSFIYF